MTGPRLDAWRCLHGHVQLHTAPRCPSCGGAMRRARVSADARLIAVTTVRVNPSGRPFVLAVAVTRCGRARTLCVVRSAIRGDGHDAVRLHDEGGVIVAVARGREGRIRGRNPVRPSTPGDSRRN